MTTPGNAASPIKHKGEHRCDGRCHLDCDGSGTLMGIDWMTKDELNEALPPAYTEHIGAALMAEVLRRQEVAA